MTAFPCLVAALCLTTAAFGLTPLPSAPRGVLHTPLVGSPHPSKLAHGRRSSCLRLAEAAPAAPSPLSAPATPSTSPRPAVTGATAQQAWVRPAVWNTPIFRTVALITACAAAAVGSSSLSARLAAFAHLVAFGCLFGSSVYTTFLAGITMFKSLPRQTFGNLQSKLFPMYFRLHAVSLVVMLGTLKFLAGAAELPFRRPLVTVSVAFVATLANLLFLEPQSTKVMFQRYELENAGKRDTEEYKIAAKKFGPLHGMSSLANLVALICTVAHSWWLGGLLRV